MAKDGTTTIKVSIKLRDRLNKLKGTKTVHDKTKNEDFDDVLRALMVKAGWFFA
jgi:hypothetical protein